MDTVALPEAVDPDLEVLQEAVAMEGHPEVAETADMEVHLEAVEVVDMVVLPEAVDLEALQEAVETVDTEMPPQETVEDTEALPEALPEAVDTEALPEADREVELTENKERWKYKTEHLTFLHLDIVVASSE